ncbi:hypothetical protein [Methylococcus capsulatus]|jgi:hypothetical protein|uniref:hypothetical protein n=1 Tax=Methylococcus capsulatus TaxID=414 RepID=UPI001C529105|nr:hypothetical protein [Methylococcus capsulatus]QXP90119.1 hypothetical protein KW114_13830 [Methylococcus capsulatus]
MNREFDDPNRPTWRPCRDCGIHFEANRPWHVQCPKCWRLELKSSAYSLDQGELDRLDHAVLELDFVPAVGGPYFKGTPITELSDAAACYLFRRWLRQERDRIAREHDIAARRRSIRAVPDPDDDPPPRAA